MQEERIQFGELREGVEDEGGVNLYHLLKDGTFVWGDHFVSVEQAKDWLEKTRFKGTKVGIVEI
jgi:hypothetical protein